MAHSDMTDQNESETPAVELGMKFTRLHVQNFKGLKDIELPLSQFGCLIGENNSGKSSALQALLLLLPSGGRKATVDDFYDRTKEIRIALHISEITDADLDRLSAAHRESVAADIVDGSVTYVRVIKVDGASVHSSLVIQALGPKNEKWLDENVKEMMTGNRGAALRAAVVAEITELDAILPAAPTQAIVREELGELIKALPPEKLTLRDKPLGTGIEAGLKSFLPEPIYIEAVKDVADEVKTTDAATFGKLLGILLDEVQDEFADIEARFHEIQRQLSRVTDVATGKPVDFRLDEVKAIESLINGYVRESFPDVELQIEVPVPRMKTILSSAAILANDGHDGPIVGKGDGLKRAVAFAILRAYTTLKNSGIKLPLDISKQTRYWLLFEEPELYLHPRAQKQLFRALEQFAINHPVLVTTHSPLFFDANSTRSFVKFSKVSTGERPPHTTIAPVVVDALPVKTAFQIICHENNNIGFFAKKVVLVEGDSDAIVFPHLARLLEPAKWDTIERNIAFAKIGGKGNIASYRLFFEEFGIPAHVITDLDALINGFEKLGGSEEATVARENLLKLADEMGEAVGLKELTEGRAGDIIKSGDARGLWNAALRVSMSLDGSKESISNLQKAVDEFFAFARKSDRLDALKSGDSGIAGAKSIVLRELARNRVHVLSLGDVEDYFGAASTSKDKVKQAIDYCSKYRTIEQFRSGLGDKAQVVEAELRSIFSAIFDDDETDAPATP